MFDGPGQPDSRPRGLLLLVAAPKEVEAVAAGLGHAPGPLPLWTPEVAPGAPEIALVRTGVGKAAAAAAAARTIDPARHRFALSMGIAGSLPGSGLSIGATVLATRSLFADEGVQTPDGFIPLSQMGFGPMPDGGDGIDINQDLEVLLSRALPQAERGPVATVSRCSGTDDDARAITTRTSAIAEAMEGAAIGMVCGHLGVGFGEVRTISNTTGDRGSQRWDLAAGLEALREATARIAEAFRTC